MSKQLMTPQVIEEIVMIFGNLPRALDALMWAYSRSHRAKFPSQKH